MIDIAKCEDHSCPSCQDCFRYMAFPDEYQTYFEPQRRGKDKCEHFWPIEKSDTKNAG